MRGRVAALGFAISLGVEISNAAVGRAVVAPADAVCRANIGKGVGKLADTVVKERISCHQLRVRGTIPQNVECNDPLNAPASAKILAAKARLAVLSHKGCADASSAAANGYVTCPAPCSGVTTADYAGVSACMACLSDSWASVAVEVAYGTPVVMPFNPSEPACQHRIGIALRKYMAARFREAQRCQSAEDRGDLTAVDCVSADLKGKVARALGKARDIIAHCEPGAVPGLDSCGSTVQSVQDCITATATQSADTLFYAVYFPAVPTPTPTGTLIDTPTPTRTPTPVYSPTRTPSDTVTPTPTPTVTDTPTRTYTPTPLPPLHVDITPFPPQSASQYPCLLFVHGKRTDTGTFTNWNEARDYWKSGARDLVREATKNFAASYYVVGYNGSQAYWDTQAAGEVASEIVNASNGGNDGGGNHCARTYAEGGTFWVVGHSMAGSVIDYILGNDDPSDPNYNLNGPYDVAAARLSLAIAIAGTHRGSQGADLVCGGGNPFCSFFAGFVQDCDTATYWLRSSDDVQVRSFANSPGKTVWLTSGYAAIPGASLCLTGEDDGIVQFASAFACNGSATGDYDTGNVCNNSNKQEASGFKNLDTGHENHDEERNDSDRDNRRAIPTGIWVCNGSACSAGSNVQDTMSTAQLIATLY